MKTPIKFILSFALLLLAAADIAAQELITNVYGRDVQSLNGKWDAIVDLYDQGRKNKIYLNRKPEGKTDFYEYSFDNGLRLDVPSDWNCQMPELKYYEGTVWYARRFDAPEQAGRRQFLYFGAVSYRCRVYLNGEEIGAHEGGFTPFEIEVTGRLKPEGNFLAVEVNNTRTTDAIPAMAFDWWNYGGITRDVMLVSVPDAFIRDYFIRLGKDSDDRIDADVQLAGAAAGTAVRIEIPELNVDRTVTAGATGTASASFRVRKLQRWSPADPKLYRVIVSTDRDRVPQYPHRGRRDRPQRLARVPQVDLVPRRDPPAHGPGTLRDRRRDAAQRGQGTRLQHDPSGALPAERTYRPAGRKDGLPALGGDSHLAGHRLRQRPKNNAIFVRTLWEPFHNAVLRV